MLELWLAKLEESSFGVSGFRKHVHKITGTTATQAGHNHKVSVITGPPWPGAGGHIHRIIGLMNTFSFAVPLLGFVPVSSDR